MKIAIVGSRDYAHLDRVRDFVKALPAGTTVISGGARGVDEAAEAMAYAIGLPVQSFPADWATHGKKAGILRNAEIVAAADEVVAFWDGISAGTRSSIELAQKAGKPIRIIGQD
jgi:hypothetical protein